MSFNIDDASLNNTDFIDGLHALNNIDGLLSDFELIKKFASVVLATAKQKSKAF